MSDTQRVKRGVMPIVDRYLDRTDCSIEPVDFHSWKGVEPRNGIVDPEAVTG